MSKPNDANLLAGQVVDQILWAVGNGVGVERSTAIVAEMIGAYKPEPVTEAVGQPEQSTFATAAEAVDHPKHYNTGKIEVIDAIDEWKLGFALGNAVKYIARAGKKDPAKAIEDLEKSRWYVDHEIKTLSAKGQSDAGA